MLEPQDQEQFNEWAEEYLKSKSYDKHVHNGVDFPLIDKTSNGIGGSENPLIIESNGNDGVVEVTGGGSLYLQASAGGDVSLSPTGGGKVTLTESGSGGTAYLDVTNITSDHTYIFPNASGTLSIGASIDAFTGNGADGSVTFNGSSTILGMVPSGSVYTMTRDIFCTDITINNGVTLKTSGYRIFFTGTLTNNGAIRCNGNDASGSTGATALPTGSIYGGVAGQNGIGGTVYGGGSGNGNNGTAGTAQTESIGVAGAKGGNGGEESILHTGGTGGSGGGVTAPTQSPYIVPWAIQLRDLQGEATIKYIKGPAGSGSGAEGGHANVVTTGIGGGSGGSGGMMVLVGKTIINNSTISANGGAGGNATAPTGGGGTAGGSGGGAGGSGGVIICIYQTLNNNGTISVNGGTGGSGSAGYTGGGGAPTAGQNGATGNTGSIYNFQLI